MRRAEIARELASKAHAAEELGDHRAAARLLAEALRTLLTPEPTESGADAGSELPKTAGVDWSKFLEKFHRP